GINSVQIERMEVKTMAYAFCPECGHEVSGNAAACPNCGRPLSAGVVAETRGVEEIKDPKTGETVGTRPVVERNVVTPGPVRARERFPAWATALMVLAGIVVVAALYFAFRGTEDSTNANIRLNAANRANTERNVAASVPTATPDETQTAQAPG